MTDQGLDVERLARAIGIIAIEDRDRVIAGDYSADTYEEHAARLAVAYASLGDSAVHSAVGPATITKPDSR